MKTKQKKKGKIKSTFARSVHLEGFGFHSSLHIQEDPLLGVHSLAEKSEPNPIKYKLYVVS